MPNVEIVIKIDDKLYNRIKYLESKTTSTLDELMRSVRNGMILPEGHGRLIDADELKKIIKENDALTMTGFSVRLCDINNTPTIIEADKAESED